MAMPSNREVALLLSARDRASETINQIRGNIRAFTKELNNIQIGSQRYNELQAALQGYQRQLEAARGIHGGFLAQLQGGLSSIAERIRSLGPIIASAFSIVAIKKFVEASNTQEQAIARLQAALRAHGDESKESEDKLRAFAVEMQKQTTYADEDVMSLEAMLVGITGMTRGVEPLTKAVLDLASGMHISTEQAARMVGKTQEGAEGLKRMGITIGETSSETERLDKIVAAINERFGNTSILMGQTAAGQMARFKNSVRDAEESFGEIVKNVAVAVLPILNTFIKAVSSAPVPIQAMILAIGGLSAAFITLGISMTPVTLGIGAAIAAGVALTAWIGSAKHSIDDLKGSMSSLEGEQTKLSHVESLLASYEKIKVSADQNKAKQGELKKAIAEIAAAMPEAVTAWDADGHAIDINTGKVRENIAAQRDFQSLQMRDFILKSIVSPLSDAVEKLSESRDRIANAKKEADGMTQAFKAAGGTLDIYGKAISEADYKQSALSDIMRISSANVNESRKSIGQLLDLLRTRVDITNFEAVDKFLRTLGVDSKIIDQFRANWNEMLSTVEQTPKKSGEASAAVVVSLASMQEKAKELNTELSGLQYGSAAYIAKLREWSAAQHDVEDAQEEMRKKSAEFVAGIEVTKRGIDGHDGVVAALGRLNMQFASTDAVGLSFKIKELNKELEQAVKDADINKAADLRVQIDAMTLSYQKLTRQIGDLPLVKVPPLDPADFMRSINDVNAIVQRLQGELESLPIESEAWKAKLDELIPELLKVQRVSDEISLKKAIAEMGDLRIQWTAFWRDSVGATQSALKDSFKALLDFSDHSHAVDVSGINAKYNLMKSDMVRRNELADIEDQKAMADLQTQLQNKEISEREYELRVDDIKANALKRRQELAGLNTKKLQELNAAYQDNTETMLDKLKNVWAAFWDKLVDNALDKLANLAVSSIFDAVSGPLGGILGGLFGGIFHSGGTAGAGSFLDSPLGGTSLDIPLAHEGMNINAPPEKEFLIKVRGGETIRTERQEAEIQRVLKTYHDFSMQDAVRQATSQFKSMYGGNPSGGLQAFHSGGRVGLDSSRSSYNPNQGGPPASEFNDIAGIYLPGPIDNINDYIAALSAYFQRMDANKTEDVWGNIYAAAQAQKVASDAAAAEADRRKPRTIREAAQRVGILSSPTPHPSGQRSPGAVRSAATMTADDGPRRGAAPLTINVFGPIASKDAFKALIEDGMRELGITDVTRFFVNNRAKTVIQ